MTSYTRAAVVHVEHSHPQGSPLRRRLLDGEWPLHQKSTHTRGAFLAGLELLLPVAYRDLSGRWELTVLEVRRIIGHQVGANGRVLFATVPALEWAHLVGGRSPVAWTSGQAWPVKVVDLPAAGGPRLAAAA